MEQDCMSRSLKTTKLQPFQEEEAVMEGKSSWILWLLGVVIGGMVSTACWFAFSVSGRVSLEGNISGGAGSRPEVVSHPSDSQPDSDRKQDAKPAGTGGTGSTKPSDHNLKGLWISERSGKSYIVDETDGAIRVFEDGLDHHKVEVGRGQKSGRHLSIPFSSTLDNIDGILELEVSNDGRTLNGSFRGLDATKEGRVRLLRSIKN
jgi:hypothetical protein